MLNLIRGLFPKKPKPPHIELRPGVGGWHFTVVGANGEAICHSETYIGGRGAADRGARSLAKATGWEVRERKA